MSMAMSMPMPRLGGDDHDGRRRGLLHDDLARRRRRLMDDDLARGRRRGLLHDDLARRRRGLMDDDLVLRGRRLVDLHRYLGARRLDADLNTGPACGTWRRRRHVGPGQRDGQRGD
jgi:hypothetical protein